MRGTVLLKLARNATLFGLMATVVTGCNPIHGRFEVAKELALETYRTEFQDEYCNHVAAPDYDCPKKQVKAVERFSPGQYRANLDFESERSMTLKLADGKRGEREIPIQIPGDVTLPRHQGEFWLKAAEIGQAFDLEGTVETNVARSQPTRAVDICQYQVERWACPGGRYRGGYGYVHGFEAEPTFTPGWAQVSHGHRHRRRGKCGYRLFTISGQRQVEFFDERTTREVKLELKQPGTPISSASFDGAQSTSRRVYTAQGACY